MDKNAFKVFFQDTADIVQVREEGKRASSEFFLTRAVRVSISGSCSGLMVLWSPHREEAVV